MVAALIVFGVICVVFSLVGYAAIVVGADYEDEQNKRRDRHPG